MKKRPFLNKYHQMVKYRYCMLCVCLTVFHNADIFLKSLLISAVYCKNLHNAIPACSAIGACWHKLLKCVQLIVFSCVPLHTFFTGLSPYFTPFMSLLSFWCHQRWIHKWWLILRVTVWFAVICNSLHINYVTLFHTSDILSVYYEKLPLGGSVFQKILCTDATYIISFFQN